MHKPTATTSFVRKQLLLNPDITIEQIQAAWDKEGLPADKKPVVQNLYSVRMNLRDKYGVKNLSDIPRKTSGEPNVSGLLRLLRKKHGPKLTEAQARNYLKSDEIDFHPSLWNQISKEPVEVASVPVEESPDPKQGAGPRARKQVGGMRRGRKTNAERSQRVEDRPVSFEKSMIVIEKQLEAMIEEAKSIGQSKVVDDLRDARRRISRSILSLYD